MALRRKQIKQITIFWGWGFELRDYAFAQVTKTFYISANDVTVRWGYFGCDVLNWHSWSNGKHVAQITENTQQKKTHSEDFENYHRGRKELCFAQVFWDDLLCPKCEWIFEFEQLYHCVVVWPWTHDLTTEYLNFCI